MASKYKTEQEVRKEIEHEIKSGNNNKEFLVVDSMPGFGKTYHTIAAIVDTCRNNPSSRIAVVVPFGPKHVNASNIAEEVNRQLGYEAAMYVGKDNYAEISTRIKIRTKQVILITHKRYIDICFSKARIADVLIGRDTLIIDEAIIFATMVELTYSELKKILLFAPSTLRDDVKYFVDVLSDLINESSSARIIRNATLLLDGIDDLINQVKSTYTEEYVTDYRKFGVTEFPSRESYLTMIEKLQHFHNEGTIIVAGSRGVEGAVIAKRDFKPVLLNNNIMLTGSARTVLPFDYSPYKKMNTPNFLDFSKWKIHIDNNRSGSKFANSFRIDLVTKYYDLISSVVNKGDEILIVSSDEAETAELAKLLVGITGCTFHFTTYHNNVGTNNYAKCNKIFLMSLPKISNNLVMIYYQSFENPTLTETIWSLFNGYYINHESINDNNEIPNLKNTPTVFWSNMHGNINNQIMPKSPFLISNKLPNICATMHKNNNSFYTGKINLANRTVAKDVDLSIGKRGGIHKFNKSRIRAYKNTLMVEILLQTILRINRSQKLNADVYMVNKDDDVTKELIRLMPNINVVYDINLNYDKKQRKYDSSNRMAKSHVSKLIYLLNEKGKGSHKKSEIRETLGIDDKTAFTKLLKHNDFVDYCIRNDIVISNRYIVVQK